MDWRLVVTSAQFLIDSESNVAEVMRSMIGGGGQGGAKHNATAADKDALDAKGADVRDVPAISPPSKK